MDIDSPPSQRPPGTQRNHSSKRKRLSSSAGTTTAALNPRSHTPDTLRQFARAGHSPDAPVPSETDPGFPHRPLLSDRLSAVISRGGLPRAGDRSNVDDEVEAEVEGEGDDDIDEQKHHARRSRRRTADFDLDAPRRRRAPPASSKHTTPGSRSRTEHANQLGPLVAIIQRCLTAGNIILARRAFGLLARADVYGTRVDLRFDRFWELGAEILARDGEEAMLARRRARLARRREKKKRSQQLGVIDESQEEVDDDDDEDEDEADEDRLAREKEQDAEHLRASANSAQLKAYYETLIRQHPWVKMHPGSVSAVDFYPALFASEMEGVYSAHVHKLHKLEDGALVGGTSFHDAMALDDDEDDDEEGVLGYQSQAEDEDPEGRPNPSDRRSTRDAARLKTDRERDVLRRAALAQMKDLARRMDAAMEPLPFARDHALLRLRAMVALYMADLAVPAAPRSAAERDEGMRVRALERKRARRCFGKIRLGGGEVDEDLAVRDALVDSEGEGDEDDEEEEEDEGEEDGGRGGEVVALPMFSSLPIRGT
ncbi:hypothetical protein B0T22DRAFT_535388 [Podospora appendiculata]|uniref:Uncharacterized protein n=1 Tax=Podospora appendiculata TaxID=314037 RepID=A0AAE0X8T6_9PEZI|nr:hypothetical protein B0T22DRAFT_535388 [Podospora appendiculata]